MTALATIEFARVRTRCRCYAQTPERAPAPPGLGRLSSLRNATHHEKIVNLRRTPPTYVTNRISGRTPVP